MARKVLITGASKGIGRAIARLLIENGWEAYLTARSSDELEQLKVELTSRIPDARLFSLPADLGDLESLNSLVKRLGDFTERLDALVLNAGVGVFSPISEISEADYESVMRVNLKGTFFLAKELFSFLQQSSCPRLVGITSDVARRTFSGGSIYTMSKYAQDALYHTLRKEWRSSAVRVSVIMPGLTDTSFGGSEVGAPHKAEWLRPEDVASAVAYVLHAPDHVVIDEILLHPFCQDWQP